MSCTLAAYVAASGLLRSIGGAANVNCPTKTKVPNAIVVIITFFSFETFNLFVYINLMMITTIHCYHSRH